MGGGQSFLTTMDCFYYQETTEFWVYNKTYNHSAPLPSCANDIFDLHRLINSGSSNAEICSNARILFHNNISYIPNFIFEHQSFKLEVPDGVKISCPSGDCVLERRAAVGFGRFYGWFDTKCAFFNYDVNSRVSIEGVTFQELESITMQTQEYEPFEILDATKVLIAFDDMASTGPTVPVAITTKGSTYYKKKGEIKKKGEVKKKKQKQTGSRREMKTIKNTDESIRKLDKVWPDVCSSYNPDGTVCPQITAQCASDLYELFCMVMYAPEQHEIQICSGQTIFFGTFDASPAANVGYYLTVPDKVKITCPTNDCFLRRRTFTRSDFNDEAMQVFQCPFFTVGLNSHATFEGLIYQELYLPAPVFDDEAVRNTTKELIGVDNQKPIPGPLTISGKSTTSTKKTKGRKKRNYKIERNDYAATAVAGAIFAPQEDAIYSSKSQSVNLATDYSFADSNGDGLVDCIEADEFLLAKGIPYKIECIKFLQHFAGSDAALGVSYQQFEDVGLNAPSIYEIFV